MVWVSISDWVLTSLRGCGQNQEGTPSCELNRVPVLTLTTDKHHLPLSAARIISPSNYKTGTKTNIISWTRALSHLLLQTNWTLENISFLGQSSVRENCGAKRGRRVSSWRYHVFSEREPTKKKEQSSRQKQVCVSRAENVQQKRTMVSTSSVKSKQI